jgi:hypothetical protein
MIPLLTIQTKIKTPWGLKSWGKERDIHVEKLKIQ